MTHECLTTNDLWTFITIVEWKIWFAGEQLIVFKTEGGKLWGYLETAKGWCVQEGLFG